MKKPVYPPEYDQPDPGDEIEYEIATAECHTCSETFGPDHAVDIGYELMLNHEGHDTEMTDKWIETEVVE